jgi:predicted acyl esterase
MYAPGMGLRRGVPLVVIAFLAFGAAPASADGCQEISVTMSDGVRLDGWFVPAASGGKAPVLWTMTPYTNTGCPGGVTGMDSQLTSRFNVVRLSYRGTGASEGVSDEWGPQTRKDVLEVGQWLVSQPWANGLVPAGTSAEGAWITYALEIPEVKATLWETSCADALRGCIRNGGTLAGGIAALTEGDVTGYAAGMPQRVQNGYATNPDPAEQWTGQVPFIVPAYLDDTETSFWQERLGLKYLARVHAPVMFTTDLYDFVPEGMYVAYEHTAPRYRWLDLGYGHAASRAEYTGGTPLNGLVFGPVRRFLEHFVFGDDNGFEHEPRVTVVNNLGTPSGYERGEVLVRGERRWPLPSTRFTRLHLGAGTLTAAPASSEKTDTAPVASVGPTGELRTTLVASGSLPQDQQNTLVTNLMDDLSPREAAGLTYTTPPLAENVELTGPVVAHLFASTTAPNFDWQVRLTDVHPDGRSSWITDGQLRASLREIDPARSRRDRQGDIIRPWYTFAAHQSVPLGQVVEYYVELGPTSNIFRAGDRIRFDIQPAADAYVDSARTGGAGVLQIARGGGNDSSVLLPLIPHRCGQSVAPVAGLNPPADCAGMISFAPVTG